jgi:hypothetical protein
MDANKDVVPKVNAEITKHILLFLHQNSRKYHDIKTAKIFFQNMAQYKYLGTTVTNKNIISKKGKAVPLLTN